MQVALAANLIGTVEFHGMVSSASASFAKICPAIGFPSLNMSRLVMRWILRKGLDEPKVSIILLPDRTVSF